MLLRFQTENFRSIQAEQEISMVASTLRDDGVDLITSETSPKLSVLPALLIYGANASGKSTIIGAIARMRSFVLASHSMNRSSLRLNHKPFLLDESSSGKETRFEIDFECNGTRYSYGFRYNSEKIESEWLYSYPLNLPRKLFSRDSRGFSFGRELKGRNKVISELTRDNSLFLAVAAANNHEELSTVARYFEEMTIETSLSLDAAMTSASILRNDDSSIGRDVIEFLGKAETGVCDYRLIKKERTEEAMSMTRKLATALSGVLKEIDDDFELEIPDWMETSIELSHKSSNGEMRFLPMEDESAGTIRLLAALPKIFKSLSKGTPVFIDEIDLSLHTKAAEEILKLFASKVTNPKGAQLIATTHDTNLLSSDFVRRDQVWFTEKNQIGATEIYPLTDIATRKGDDLERGYLQGRFGAIPF